MRQDLHVHTVFSDGNATPEEMVLSAIEKGLERIGFSDHSYTYFDESYCMKQEQIPAYRACIADLKARYDGQIEILCGIEQDFYSTESTDGYDYIIGSVHYIRCEEELIPVDETPAHLIDAAARYFDGDIYAVAERYFDTVSRVVAATKCDIIGHLDLITKFQGETPLLDTAHPRYVSAARRAADALLTTGKPFEINTSPLFRGAKTSPYPDTPLLDYLYRRGASFVLAGDCHSTEMLGYAFAEYQKYV